MLEELSIRDFAIIDRLSVRFEEGLNLLSGETGAGKSILIGALGFILGNKADTGIIRAGAEEAMVSGVIRLGDYPQVLSWLSERGLDAEDGALVLRRGLKSNGRGSIYIQNAPATRQDLSELAGLLIEMHGQKDGQALLRRERHRAIVDRYAGIEAEVADYGRLYAELSAKRAAIATMASSEAERARETELLRFALEELEAAKVLPGEDDALAEEERRLAQHEKLYAAASQAAELVADADGAVSRLRKARSLLESAVAIDQRLADTGRRLDDAYYELEDVGESMRAYVGALSFDPGRLEEIESRLSLLQRLKRKYGPELSDVVAYRDGAVSRLDMLEHWEEDRAGVEREAAALEAEVHARAGKISAERAEASRRLEAAVQDILATLGMPSARFAIRIDPKPLSGGKVVVGPYGADELEFYVSANRGEPPRPLADVASGGELSRVILAIKTIIAEDDGVPTMVFDEVDQGIGGEVALGVGRHLAELAKAKQVLCITHLASIAVRADNHYKVEKKTEGDRTVTRVSRLEGELRIREIARMLSGDADAEASLAHAADLLNKYGSARGQ